MVEEVPSASSAPAVAHPTFVPPPLLPPSSAPAVANYPSALHSPELDSGAKFLAPSPNNTPARAEHSIKTEIFLPQEKLPPAFQTSNTELMTPVELSRFEPVAPLSSSVEPLGNALASLASKTPLPPSPSLPSAVEFSNPSPLEKKPTPPAQTSAKPKTKNAQRKRLLLFGVCVLGAGIAVSSVRPSFLFPVTPQTPPVQILAPLPKLSEMQTALHEGNQQALRKISAVSDLLSRGDAEQALLWCRSTFSLALVENKPEGLKSALDFMARLPKDTPSSVELLKTQAAYALLTENATQAIEILTDLPEKDGERAWLLAQAYIKQGNTSKAVDLLQDDSEMFEPRRQKTLGDIASSKGEHARAIEAYTKAHAHPPWQAEMDLAIAKSWLNANRPEKTLAQLSAWENSPPDEGLAPYAWGLIAHAQLELELYPEAALTLEKLKNSTSPFAEPMARLFVATGDPKKAAALLAEEVKNRPEDLSLAQQYSHALLLGSQPAEAENFARKLLQNNPENVAFWLFGSAVFQKLGQLGSALAMTEKALSMQPQSVNAKLQWAAIQQRLGQFSTAQSFLEKATAESPEAAALWVALGALFHETHQLPKAKAAYAQALLKQPSSLEALTGLGRIALTEENMDELGQHVEKIEALNPRSAEGAWLGAHLLWSEGKKQEATEKLDWALRRDSSHLDFWLSKAKMAMEDRHTSRADEALTRARQLSPSLAIVNYWSGLLAEMQEDFNKAHSYFQKATETDKQNPVYPLAQSRAQLSLHRSQEAAALLSLTIAQYPANAEAPLLLARYYQQRYRCKTALPLFEKSLAIEPNNVDALHGAANCLLELTHWSRATAMLQRLLKQIPEDAGVMEKLGRASFEAGRYAQAVPWYQKALQKEPDNPPVLLNLGWAFKELGRKQDAIQAFKNYLQLEPLAPNKKMLEDEIRFLRQRY
jgi:tetratricopeptide (TPR) repeat protein